jgi:ubiquinone/menaquinone biosynthesis C-methylase UbiE
MLASLGARITASLFEPIAADVAAAVPEGARILDVGCGRGQLSILLAVRHGLPVTGIDVDPDEIARARATVRAAATDAVTRAAAEPVFLVADAAHMPFEDGSFDLVTSTFSMHHWPDPVAGLGEVRRVLVPGGRALIWDLRHGFSLFHLWTPDPVAPARASPLEVAGVTAWRWPGRFSISRRLDLRALSEAG